MKSNDDFNLRIANRAQPINGCYPFSEANIHNLPKIDVFDDDSVNNKIVECCKEVLYRSMNSRNKYRYGEQGILISTNNFFEDIDDVHEYFNGEYHKIVTDDRYKNIVTNRPVNDLIFIHNHPNNSSFSAADIKQLVLRESLIAVVAVGNRSNLFVIVKLIQSVKAYNYITNYVLHYSKNNYIDDDIRVKVENEAAGYILDNPENFGLQLFKFKRRSLSYD